MDTPTPSLTPDELTAIKLASRGVYPDLLWQLFYQPVLHRTVTTAEVHDAQYRLNTGHA